MFEPIPNFTELRAGKPGYDTRYEIDTDHPLHHDPLIDPREFDPIFADASSYHAQPIAGEVVPRLPDAPLIRFHVIKRIGRVEYFLRNHPEVRATLGAPAHLRINDGLRPNQDSVLTPHATGGAFDVTLINLETGEPFEREYTPETADVTAYPDFHEGYHLVPGSSDIISTKRPDEDSAVVLGRRVLYKVMSLAGFQVDPHNFQHYGRGDALSEYVAGTEKPYYGIPTLPKSHQQETDQIAAQPSREEQYS